MQFKTPIQLINIPLGNLINGANSLKLDWMQILRVD